MTAERLISRPYGALELKQTYQQGLFLGLLAAALLHLGALYGAQMYLRLTEGAEIPPVVQLKHLISIDMAPPPKLKEPDFGSGDGLRKAAREFEKGIPVPVPDDQVVDETLIATRVELEYELNRPADSLGTGTTNSKGDNGTVDTGEPELIVVSPFVVLSREPEPLPDQPQPKYPEFAKLARLEGTVRLRILVGNQGDVLDVQLLGRSGSVSPCLEEAAKEAVWKWKFVPGQQQDRKVAALYDQMFVFRLESN